MPEEVSNVSKECKIFLFVDSVIGIISGFFILLIPGLVLDLLNWTDCDVVTIRVLGAVIIGFSSAPFIVSFDKDLKWKEVRTTMEMEVVLLIFGIFTIILSHTFLKLPITVLAVLFEATMIILLVSFLVFIIRERPS